MIPTLEVREVLGVENTWHVRLATEPDVWWRCRMLRREPSLLELVRLDPLEVEDSP